MGKFRKGDIVFCINTTTHLPDETFTGNLKYRKGLNEKTSYEVIVTKANWIKIKDHRWAINEDAFAFECEVPNSSYYQIY